MAENLTTQITGGNNQVLPQAQMGIQVYHQQLPAQTSRLEALFQQLEREFQQNEQLQQVLDDLKRYRTKLRHTPGLKVKLQDGGFKESAISQATRSKQAYVKRATQYQYYESAQRIDAYLLAQLLYAFNTYALPAIERGEPLGTVRQLVQEKVISPVLAELNTCGPYDTLLHYTADHLYGMVYYLTGKCFINWKDYE